MTLTLPLPDIAAQFQVRRDIVFLNHGSYGACPRPVFEAYQNWQRELEYQPVEFLGRRVPGLLADARAALAGYLGTRADDIVFVPNATYGINAVARSLELQPGDEVLTTDHEYGAVDRTWRFICGQQGAAYINQPVALPLHDPAEVVAQLWAGVTPRTKVISISHITSPTALIFPVTEICRRAREAGILTVVDGAHAPGQINLDLDAIGADFYTGNCHKWLCSPKGAAFLYARPEVKNLLKPLVVSWGYESRTPSGSNFQDYFGWTGTADPSAYLSVPAAIAFLNEYNWPEVRLACHRLLLDASRRMSELTEVEPIVPDTTAWWMQLRALPLPQCNAAETQHRLYDEYQVEVPIVEWNGRQFVRVSIQAYTKPSDIDRLVEAIAAIVMDR
ncbi:MAG: aminotransferase class V-fold PLP-dependent enzyme [Roseiflexaceae bacterium]|nr:aminotransferase class V-fold PLP-dependent enzyme [Roseiflexaceae bacterium]